MSTTMSSSSEPSSSSSEERGSDESWEEEEEESSATSGDSFHALPNNHQAYPHMPQGTPPPCLDAFEDEDMVSLWRGHGGDDEFPKQMIECLIEGEELYAYYSLQASAHPTYEQQEEDLKNAMKSPSLNLTTLSTMSPKAKKQKLSPYEVSRGEVGGGRGGGRRSSPNTHTQLHCL